MTLPIGAEEIARARDNGQRPADQVVVSLCGWRREFSNPQVLATRKDHVWTFLAGLDVIVCVSREALNVRSTLRALAPLVGLISLWDVDRKAGVTLWPVWRGLNQDEVHSPSIEDRRDARFVRWGKATWLASENARFAA